MAVLRAAAMAIVVTVGLSQSSNIGTAGTVVVACASVEIVVGAVLEIVRTVCLLRQHLQVPGVHRREEHQVLCRLKRSPHPC